MISKDLHWLAGIYEGEGCFIVSGRKRFGKWNKIPYAVVRMNDADVIQRVARLVGVTAYRSHTPSAKKAKSKPSWVAEATGRRAAGIAMTLYPLLGIRRQAAIRKLLHIWKTTGMKGQDYRCRAR